MTGTASHTIQDVGRTRAEQVQYVDAPDGTAAAAKAPPRLAARSRHWLGSSGGCPEQPPGPESEPLQQRAPDLVRALAAHRASVALPRLPVTGIGRPVGSPRAPPVRAVMADSPLRIEGERGVAVCHGQSFFGGLVRWTSLHRASLQVSPRCLFHY